MKSDLQFKYEKEALDVALATGSARVSFPTPGKAVAFRQRCYAFRKWKRDTMGDQSPYELLTIPAIAKGALEVVITGRKFEGTIVPGQGEPITAPAVEPEAPSLDLDINDDDLDLVASIKEKVGL